MKALLVGLVLLGGCASWNVRAFGVPLDPAPYHAQMDDPNQANQTEGWPWYIFVITLTAAAFGVYAGSSA